jgi:hypothetical protein
MTRDTVLPLLDALYERSDTIRYVTTKFEMSTAAMAGGYSRATGELGCTASSALLLSRSSERDHRRCPRSDDRPRQFPIKLDWLIPNP